jgi:low affinity Fe/Cu permease
VSQPRSVPHLRAEALLPSGVAPRVGMFDRFAGWASRIASRAPFFTFCLVLVAVWVLQGVVTILVTGEPSRFLDDKFQLEINTTTTIITFLLVALLQNSASRADQAAQHKLNAIADGLADLMDHLSEHLDDDGLRADIAELRLAVGLEERETTTKHHAVSAATVAKPATEEPSRPLVAHGAESDHGWRGPGTNG